MILLKKHNLSYPQGTISVSTIVTGAITGLAMIGSVFAWTYTQFNAVTTHASQTDITVSAIQQKTNDIDTRLNRIENKIDFIIQNK